MPKVTSTASVVTETDGASYYGQATTNSILTRLFRSCSDDPKSSIHRAWGLTLILLVVFFVVAVIESKSYCIGPLCSTILCCSVTVQKRKKVADSSILVSLVALDGILFCSVVNLKSSDGSRAVMIAAVFTGVIHMVLGILGTFVLKRFPTSFSIGFFMGVLVVLANQNFILTGTFFWYSHGNPQTNRVFANLGFGLFLVLALFALMLFHFKGEMVVAPVDTKHHHAQKQRRAGKANHTTEDASQHATDYSQYTEEPPHP